MLAARGELNSASNRLTFGVNYRVVWLQRNHAWVLENITVRVVGGFRLCSFIPA